MSNANFIENSPHTLWSFENLPDLTGALCDLRSGADPESWFLDDPVIEREAQRVCHRCPVREACLTSAYEEEEQTGFFAHGIRGGKLAKCRQIVLNERRKEVNGC